MALHLSSHWTLRLSAAALSRERAETLSGVCAECVGGQTVLAALAWKCQEDLPQEGRRDTAGGGWVGL